jgi:hypothetical protein
MPEFVGFCGPAYVAPSIYQDAQECINWYLEIDPVKPEGARGRVTLYPTPGLTALVTPGPQAEVRALYVLPGGSTMLAVVGSNLYTISASFVSTNVGSLASSSGRVSITDNNVAAYLVDGSNRYSYTIATGVFAQISSSDGAFTGGDVCDYVDDFIVYNEPNSYTWAATSALSTVTPALSFASKDSSTDNIVSLIVDKREVILLGETTTERWINAGSYPFPFQRIPGVSIQHGCAAKWSVARLGEDFAWLSRDTRGQGVVVQMEGYQPKRLSTHAVENDISSGVISDAVAFTYQVAGHEFYVINFPTQDKTWVYDLATEQWHKRAWRDISNRLHRIRPNVHASFQGYNVVGDWANGTIYRFDSSNYTDNGQTILRLRRAPHVTTELDWTFHESIQIQFHPGVGLQTGQGRTPYCMLRWSDDGGATWSNSYNVQIGAAGQTKWRAIKKALGRARDRVYEVSITDPVYASIISANLDITKGAY